MPSDSKTPLYSRWDADYVAVAGDRAPPGRRNENDGYRLELLKPRFIPLRTRISLAVLCD